jgi:ribonuclease P protein component
LLDQVHRMRSSEDFRVTVRRGARAVRPTLVTHVVLSTRADAGEVDGRATSVGLVVNRGVGTSVDRNRVKRRLRHLMRARLADVPVGSRIVIRALPAARDATSSALAADLDAALPAVGTR